MIINEDLFLKITKGNINKIKAIGLRDIHINDVINIGTEKYSLIFPRSNKRITAKCEYCGAECSVCIYVYNDSIKNNHKYCCKSCASQKHKEILIEKYGVDNIQDIKGVREKTINTNLRKYGVREVNQSKEVLQKRFLTNEEKYGGKSAFCSEEVRNKAKETTLKHYGVTSLCFTEEFQEKSKDALMKKYGSVSPFVDEDVRKKAFNSYTKDDRNISSSKQQLYIYDLLKNTYKDDSVFNNYPVYPLTIDVALLISNRKIAIEYDGWYWHRSQQRDAKKAYKLMSLGWNFIRIQGGRKLPNTDELLKLINNVITSNKKYQVITLDDWVDYEKII